MVKKIVLSIISLAILIGLSVWGFMYYKRLQSFDIEIPKQADRVIRLNVEQMGKKLISTDFSAKKGKKERGNGIDIPFNIFAFGIKGLPHHCLFVKLAIADQKDFEAWLGRDFKAEASQVYTHKSKLFSCVYNKKHLVMISSKELTDTVLTVAKGFLEEKEVISFEKSSLYTIRASEADIAMDGSWGSGSLNFEPGALNAELITNGYTKEATKLYVPKNASLAILSSENPARLLHALGLEQRKDTAVSYPDFQACFQNEFALFVDGEVQQSEKIVQYVFDDNFEKVAVSETVQKPVPNIFFYAYLNNTEQVKILRDNKLLYGTDSFNKAMFPLFDLKYGINTANLFSLYSGTQAVQGYSMPEQTTLMPDEVLKAWCTVDKIAQMAAFKELKTYLKPFRRLSLTGALKDKDKTVYTLKLSFADTQKSSLKQLLDLF
ncbi:hypothetical protein DBR32_09810 [Taibaiella sp. KBW10]|uniref:hypothetical protein n=1 Tax=Taibaiella sp. KBW10 TaxID=2153357 RepID=UPI000F597D7C|nr:hypothetical protein [Taibaiella sp. KBW10]RQO30993.1 hypothetical protein DBR32_09810 [Taibaiella sp. KBW10]